MIYLFVFAHLVADFILQPYALVRRKSHWDGLLLHGGIVLACMLLLPLFERQTLILWPQMVLITAIHIAADRWKVRHSERFFRHPIGPFLLDQAIHLTTLALVLGGTLPGAQVWMSASSSLALPALYGSVYIIACFAAPIGIMTWLDPIFQYGALAAQARLHSFVAGALVITLILFAGLFALPIILIALAVLLRRPLSQHPLDSTTGTMAVVCVAAICASLLLM